MRHSEDARYPWVMLSGEHRVDSWATVTASQNQVGKLCIRGEKNVEINRHERKRGEKMFSKALEAVWGGLNPAGLSHVILYDLFPVSAFEKHG